MSKNKIEDQIEDKAKIMKNIFKQLLERTAGQPRVVPKRHQTMVLPIE